MSIPTVTDEHRLMMRVEKFDKITNEEFRQSSGTSYLGFNKSMEKSKMDKGKQLKCFGILWYSSLTFPFHILYIKNKDSGHINNSQHSFLLPLFYTLLGTDFESSL